MNLRLQSLIILVLFVSFSFAQDSNDPIRYTPPDLQYKTCNAVGCVGVSTTLPSTLVFYLTPDSENTVSNYVNVLPLSIVECPEICDDGDQCNLDCPTDQQEYTAIDLSVSLTNPSYTSDNFTTTAIFEVPNNTTENIEVTISFTVILKALSFYDPAYFSTSDFVVNFGIFWPLKDPNNGLQLNVKVTGPVSDGRLITATTSGVTIAQQDAGTSVGPQLYLPFYAAFESGNLTISNSIYTVEDVAQIVFSKLPIDGEMFYYPAIINVNPPEGQKISWDIILFILAAVIVILLILILLVFFAIYITKRTKGPKYTYYPSDTDQEGPHGPLDEDSLLTED